MECGGKGCAAARDAALDPKRRRRFALPAHSVQSRERLNGLPSIPCAGRLPPGGQVDHVFGEVLA